jgi:hypothetical protein
MMGEHLVVVFPSLLEVDDDDLLDPDCGKGLVSLSSREDGWEGANKLFGRDLQQKGSVSRNARENSEKRTVELGESGKSVVRVAHPEVCCSEVAIVARLHDVLQEETRLGKGVER